MRLRELNWRTQLSVAWALGRVGARKYSASLNTYQYYWKRSTIEVI